MMDRVDAFFEIVKKLHALREKEHSGEEAARLLGELRENAPRMMYVTDDGIPVFTMEQLAEFFGVPAEVITDRFKGHGIALLEGPFNMVQ